MNDSGSVRSAEQRASARSACAEGAARGKHAFGSGGGSRERARGRSPTWIAALIAASAWACSSDAPDANANKGACPKENPECKEIAEASAGELAVQRRRCITCHTSDKGTMAGASKPLGQQQAGIELYPPNLTPDNDTGIGTWTDDNLANAIRTGLDKEGLELCPQMKHFADMSDYEAYSIVKYLRSIPAVKNKVPRSVCPPLKMSDGT